MSTTGRAVRTGTQTRDAGLRTGILALAALILAALNLRPAISSVGPLLGPVQDAFGISSSAASLLTVIPALCMGVFAPPTPGLARRFGRDRVIACSLLVIGLATLARAFAPAASVLIGLTLLVGAAIAVAGALIGPFVKEHFPSRPALLMGVYATSLSAGASLAAVLAAPVAAMAGSWRIGLGIWAVLAAVALVLWLPLARRKPVFMPGSGSSPPRLWREGRTWRVGLFFGLQNQLFYGVIAWLAPLMIERGLSPENAGVRLSLFTGAFLVANLVVGAVAGQDGDRRPVLVVAAAAYLAGLVGLVTDIAPIMSLIAMAAGQAGAFTLGMTLPLDDARDPAEAGLRTTSMLTIGYILGSTGPLILGIARDLSGSLSLGFLILCGASLLMLALAATLGPRRRSLGQAG